MYLFSTSDQSKAQYLAMPKAASRQQEFQNRVGGHIEILPSTEECKFLAYANEEGMIEDLPHNNLSWGVLRHLGFNVSWAIPFHFGNVILMGEGGKALTKAQKALVEEAIKKYKKEIGEEEEEDDADDEDYDSESMQE